MEINDFKVPGSSESYSQLHIDFVTSQNGTTVLEILKILLSISMTPLLVSLILPWIVPPSFKKIAEDSSAFTYIKSIVEYPVVIVLPLWIITILAGDDEEAVIRNNLVWVVILCICLGIMISNYSIMEPKGSFLELWDRIKEDPITCPIPSNNKSSRREENKRQEERGDKIKYPFITNYRAIVIYVTIIAIIAVDFPIFPRRYAKTRKYGYSLMDIGTGSFIFSNGLVAPEAKDRKSNLIKSWSSSIPLFVLGFIRLISVKGIEYHEVVEEYGVHWNFFFTLAAVKLLSALIFSIIEPANSLKLSIVIAILYEVVLSQSDFLEQYLLNSNGPRENFWNANREGLCSVWGYLTIYFASVYVGKIMYCVKSQSIREWAIYTCRAAVHVGILWFIFAVSISRGNQCCRRAANATFCLWIMATNYTVLLVLVAISIIQAFAQKIGLIHGPLITYELIAAIEREDKKLKNLNQYVKKKSSKQVEVEKTLSDLEEKLKTFELSNSSSVYKDVVTFIQQFEQELNDVGMQLGENTEEELQLNSSHSNLVALPDFTFSPVLLDAISYNGLFVFLLGNVLTGLINCMVYTVYAPNFLALFYLWVYVSVICVTSLVLYVKKLQLKFW